MTVSRNLLVTPFETARIVREGESARIVIEGATSVAENAAPIGTGAVRHDDPAPSSSASHGSELGGIAAGGFAPAQAVHGTLGRTYDNAQQLTDAALAINHTHRIVIDGGDYQQGGDPPTVFGSDPKTGKLLYLSGPLTSEPLQTSGQTPQPAPAAPPASAGPVLFTDHGKGTAGWPNNPERQIRGETRGLFGGGTAIYAFDVPKDAVEGIGQLSFANLTESAANPVDLLVEVNGVTQLHQTPDLAGSCPAPGYKLGGERDANYPLSIQRGDQVVCTLRPTGTVSNDMYVDHRAPR